MTLTSWLPIAPDSDFSIYNLPFGIFNTKNTTQKRVGVAAGNVVLDLYELSLSGCFAHLNLADSALLADFLNPLMALGNEMRRQIRLAIQAWLCDPLRATPDASWMVPMSEATLHLPVQIGDYTDFYSSEDHATNVGKMFRDPTNALLPNWKHLPVGYHGRSSSIVVSGTDFHRPKGQTRPNDAEPPVFGPSKQIDFELEMAHIIGTPSDMGTSITTDDAAGYVWGFTLFNDWSARDIQKWEYVPLGPFLGKNFCSAMSPWVVTPEALEGCRVPAGDQLPEVLPYLRGTSLQNYDITLEVSILTTSGVETVISRSNFKYMYWTVAQQIAHHTVNGCPLRTGDLMASGTISGPDEGAFGSMLELAWAGKKPITLSDETTRTFIQDGDTVILRGYTHNEGGRVGFGEVRNRVLPAV